MVISALRRTIKTDDSLKPNMKDPNHTTINIECKMKTIEINNIDKRKVQRNRIHN